MKMCKLCGSMAINPHAYGRHPEEDLDLCDVHYWKVRAVRRKNKIAELEGEIEDLRGTNRGEDN